MKLLRLAPQGVALSLCYLLSMTAFAAGDAKSGADIFISDCADCHTIKAGINKKGPTLFNILNRHSGSIENFKYSPAVKSANLIWTEENLDVLMTHPKKLIPGINMKYSGLPDKKLRQDLIAYLATQK